VTPPAGAAAHTEPAPPAEEESRHAPTPHPLRGASGPRPPAAGPRPLARRGGATIGHPLDGALVLPTGGRRAVEPGLSDERGRLGARLRWGRGGLAAG
jgi:hypothetical protein